MPRTHAPLSAGEQATRSGLGGMAADVKHQHVLKCFEQSNAMTLLARFIQALLRKVRVADLRPARQESPRLRLMNEVRRSPRSSVPVEFVCRGFGAPKT